MKPEDWKRLKPIFEKAVHLEGEELERFVRDACRGDHVLLSELLELIAGDKDAGEFLSVRQCMSGRDKGQYSQVPFYQ